MYSRTSAVLSCAALLCLGMLADQANSTTTAGVVASGSAPASLRLAGRTELPGYSGDFDHFEVDQRGNRLFLAAEDHHTLEVFDLASGAHLKTIDGFDTPHGILYLADKNRLIVTDSGAGAATELDAATYRPIGSVKLKTGADAMSYDPSAGRMYVANGGKDAKLPYSLLSAIDPRTGKRTGELRFNSNKIEGMAIEQKGKRLYINVTGNNTMAVVDKNKLAVIATWPIREAQQNAPLAFDEAHHRLFAVTRKPGKLLVLNAESGTTVANFKAPEHADQVLFDEANHRIYVTGGDGNIGIFRQRDADHYEQLPSVPSAPGAKTAILVPELHRLYVAVSPGEGKTGAALLRFDVEPDVPAAR